MKANVVDLVSLSLNFPQPLERELFRDNVIATLDKNFASGTNIMVVEGEEGIGKTTLLSQFVRAHPNHAVSLFIRPLNRLSINPSSFKVDLAGQIYWVIKNKALPLQEVNDSLYVQLLTQLQRRAKHYGERFFFVIDGIHDLAREDEQVKDILFDELLHIGVPQFSFLLSGTVENIPKTIREAASPKPLLLPPFSLNDTREYLEDLDVDSLHIEALHRMCAKGLPAYLAAIRREISAGVSIEELLHQEPTKLPDFLALEWEHLKQLSHWQELVLAILAFGRGEFSTFEIAAIAAVAENDVISFFESVRIIELVDGQATFLTEGHRSFAQKRLVQRKPEVITLIIDFLTRDTQELRALESLSDYYQQAGRFNEIIAHLTPEVLVRLVKEASSLYPLHRQTQFGIDAAQQLNLFEAMLGYCFQQATLRDLSRVELWRPEVEARVALKDYAASLSLAQSAILQEDKLQLLAIVTRKQIEQGLDVAPEVSDQIYALAKQISPETLPEKILDIATNLVKLDPDLAIDLVERTSKASGKPNSLDWAFARLSTAASSQTKDETEERMADKVRSRIQDPKVQEFIGAISVFTENYSAHEVIEKVEKLELKNRLFILRRWAVTNKDRADADAVINAALDLLVSSSTEYIPKTRDLRQIATPIVTVTTEEEAKKLVKRFDGIKGTVKDLGTTVDYVRLELYLAEAEATYSTQAATDRLLELFWLISEIKDDSLRTHCLAYYVARFTLIDRDTIIEQKEGLLEVIKEKFQNDINFLLSQTADHYRVVKGPLKALSQADPDAAIGLASRLNTIHRRDRARQTFLTSHLNLSMDELRLDIIVQAWHGITDAELRSEALQQILKKLADEAVDISELQISKVLSLVTSSESLPQAIERCICYAHSIVILSKQSVSDYRSLQEKMVHDLWKHWDAIDVGWYKVDVGFQIAKILAEVAPSTASEFLKKTELERAAMPINAPAPGQMVLACLRLLVRAFGGLLPNRLEQQEDLHALSTLVDQIPSRSERIGIWSELVLRCYGYKRMDLGSSIVMRYIQPLLSDISELDAYAKHHALSAAAPALFVYHRDTTLELLGKLPINEREDAYSRICHFLLFRSLPDEPHRNAGYATNDLSYETASDICRLLELVEREDLLAGFIPPLVKHINERFTGSHQHKASIHGRLVAIIDEKLPDVENIKHDGYKVLLKAHLLLIQSSKGPEWDEVIQDANNIPNNSDRAFILSQIVSLLPKKYSGKRDQVIEQVIKAIENIPNVLDRADRYITFANDIRQNDKGAAKKHLQIALQSILSVDTSPESYSLQQRAIDIAHSIDADFAATLATVYDNDPAREIVRQEIKEKLDTLDIRDKMINQNSVYKDDVPPEQYAHAAWMALGSLNANRVETFHTDHLRKYVQVSRELPLGIAYPIFSWVVENTVRRHSGNPDRKQQLIETFRAVLRGSHFAINLAGITLNSSKELFTLESSATISSSQVFIDGQRKEALEWLKQWVESSAERYLIICDPYFGPDDLEVLLIVNSLKPDLKVTILTSRKHIMNEHIDGNHDDAFFHAWEKLSDQDPPSTIIKIAGLRSNHTLPIHDRWWITSGSGLRIGTSYRSLGIGKASEISLLTQDEAMRLEHDVIDPFLNEQREVKGERLRYTSFNL